MRRLTRFKRFTAASKAWMPKSRPQCCCQAPQLRSGLPKAQGLIAPRPLGREVAAGLTDLATYDAYTARVVEVKEKTWEFLIGARRGGKLGYGAPAKGNTFLNYCGIGRDHLAFTVDRNPAKRNTLLADTRIPVLPIREISRRRPDYVLILPWNLIAEVSQSLATIRDWGGRFVTAIPNLEIF